MTQPHPVQNEEVMLITTNTLNRREIFGEPAYAREAIDVLYRVQHLRPFFIYGFVIMPDHCRFLLRVPEPETISRIMDRYKMGVSHSLGLGPIWQRRFHIRIPQNARIALHYIHQNPVCAQIATTCENYPWSSAAGKWDLTPLEWAGD